MLDETQLVEGLTFIFGRAPTDAEIAFFSEQPSLRAAFTAAAASDAAEPTGLVVSLYQVFYGRVPEEGGYDFWAPLSADGTLDAFALGNFFATAAEFEALFAGLSNAVIVATLYQENFGREADAAGLDFWTDQLNEGNITIAELGTFFAISEEFQALNGNEIDAYLISGAEGTQSFEGSLFDQAIEGSVEVIEETAFNRTLLTLNSTEDATTIDNAPVVATGDPDEISTLRLTGDGSVRIDLTDPREIIEQFDINGDGVIEPGTAEFNVRDLFDVGFFEIIDAHPRGAALLDPTDSVNGYTGDLLFDGTGFDADGFGGSSGRLNGNIVLGGYGSDVIFTGNGNDFVSSGGLDDDIKTGRNADFIYQELSRLDDAFSGDDGEIDGGATFDDNPGQDTDWLLLEASDDEEPVVVALGGDGSGSSLALVSDLAADDGNDLDLSGLINELAVRGVITDEDLGFISTRLGNDAAAIQNLENVNASGNFYKFFDESVTTTQTSAFVGYGAFINADEAASLSQGFTFFTEDGNVSVSRGDIEAFNGGAGVQSVEDLRVLTQAAFDAAFGAGAFEVPLADADNPDGPTDTTGPIVLVNALGDNIFSSIPALNTTQDELARGNLLEDSDTEVFQSDLFFGDNRDFSEEEALFRVPGLSPGVTAQMVIFGTDDTSPGSEDSGLGFPDEIGSDVGIGILNTDGANILIAGYDNDVIAGLGGSDLLMGGDLEFLLTHQHNPNLFDTSDGTISVNGEDGVADDGRDTLIGGTGADNLVWEADGGAYGGDTDLSASTASSTADDDDDDDDLEAGDTLWLTTFSVGRTTGVDRSTDGSSSDFLAINGIGAVAAQDLTGEGEAADEANALAAVVEDLTLRFDLGVGAGYDYQGGEGTDPTFSGLASAFVGIAGADRLGTADQTNYNSGFDATEVVDVENFNASGLGGIDYLAAGEGSATGTDLTFENLQNYRGVNSDIDIRGIDLFEDRPGFFSADDDDDDDDDDFLGTALDNDFTSGRLAAQFNTTSVTSDGSAIADLLYSVSSDANSEAISRGSQSPDVAEELSENLLFANRGNDILEGRGGDDWLEGREGNDIFIVSTNDGDGDDQHRPVPDSDGRTRSSLSRTVSRTSTM